MALMISFPSMYPLYVILLIDTYGFITTPKDFSLLLSSCSIWFMLFIFPLIAKESLKHLYTASLSIYISSINSSAHCKSYIVSTSFVHLSLKWCMKFNVFAMVPLSFPCISLSLFRMHFMMTACFMSTCPFTSSKRSSF